MTIITNTNNTINKMLLILHILSRQVCAQAGCISHHHHSMASWHCLF